MSCRGGQYFLTVGRRCAEDEDGEQKTQNFATILPATYDLLLREVDIEEVRKLLRAPSAVQTYANSDARMAQ